MTKSEMFMKQVSKINESVDYAKVYQSLNGGDEVYGNEVLERIKEVHKRIWGADPMPKNKYDLIPFPAKILNEKEGTVWLGTCLCQAVQLPKGSHLYNIMHGHLYETAQILIPAEYKEAGYDPLEQFTGNSVTLTIYYGETGASQRIEYGEPEVKEEMHKDGQGETEETVSQCLQ